MTPVPLSLYSEQMNILCTTLFGLNKMKSFCFSSSLGHMQMPHITITIIIIIIQQHAISHELHFHFHYYYIYSVCVCVCRTIATPTRKTLNRKPINRKVHKQMLILHICIVIRNSKCLQSI